MASLDSDDTRNPGSAGDSVCRLAQALLGRNGHGESRSPAILVSGGAGYIGSHTAKALHTAGWLPVVYDNLSTGRRDAVQWGPFIEGDVSDVTLVRRTLREFNIRAVVHLAGSGIASESMRDPALYFENNVSASVRLLQAMRQEGVTAIVFSSSCDVYGVPQAIPIQEDHPRQPVSPYGQSKLQVEQQLAWFDKLCGFRSVILRCFNAAGADHACDLGESRASETHLIPSALKAILGERTHLSVFGSDFGTNDGTAIRDYLHVCDIAQAHVAAVDHLLAGGGGFTANLCTGRGHSVKEVLATIERVTGRGVPVTFAERQPGDLAVLVGDAARMREFLGWEPRHDLESMVASAWAWARLQSRAMATV